MDQRNLSPSWRRTALCPALIGREDELRALVGTLDAAGASAGSVALIVGEAGIGKSRLAREVMHRARERGFAVLAGRAVESGSPTPFRPLTEALLTHLRKRRPPSNPEIAPFLPALGTLVPDWRQEAGPAMDDSIVVLAEGFLRLLRALAADRGCLLVLEDLHWADPETLAILEYLSDNLQSEPAMVLCTLRSEETGTAHRLSRTLQARRTALVLDLARLSDSDVAAMVRACRDGAATPEATLRFLHLYAEGLPFLVEELLAAALEAGTLDHQHAPPAPPIPHTFAELVRSRVRALGAGADLILQAAAMLGRHFDWTLLPPITDLDDRAVLAVLRQAVELRLVLLDERQGSAGFRFRHALTRDAILGSLLPPERAALAQRAIAAVAARHQGLPDPWAVLAAELAETAGDGPRAAGLLLQAGRRALAHGALASAETTLDRARALAGHDPALASDIDEALAETLSLAGKTGRVVEVGGGLPAALATAGAPPARRARAHLLLARAANTAARREEAEQQLERARALAQEANDPVLVARIDALAAHVAITNDRPEDAAALARAAFVAAERLGAPEIACEALEVIGRCARLRDLDQARAAFERAQAIAEEHDLPVWRIRALLELGTIDLFTMSPLDRLLRTRDLALQSGILATAAVVELQIAAALMLRFAIEAGMEAARRSADLARRFHLDPVRGIALILQADAHAYLGRRAEMEQVLDEAMSVAGGHPDVAASICGVRADFALAQEQRQRAIQDLDTAMSILRRSPAASPHPLRGLWALLHAVEGQEGEAACAELRDSGATVQLVNRGYLRYAEAVLLGRAGRRTEAEAAFTRGDADMVSMPWFHQVGRRLIAEAAIADGWGDPVAWLREGSAFFGDQGLDRLAAACRSLLRKAGVPVPRQGRGEAAVPPDLRARGVTSREMDVLLLLAEGLANRDIGARLYLSPRTVERHIENLAAKLALQSRSQLVAFAASRTASA